MPEKNQTSSLPVLGALLVLGLMTAAFILGVQFKNLHQPGAITVKRLAERNFKLGGATWNTSVEAHIDSYQEVLDSLSARYKKLSKFLRGQGSEMAETQISLLSMERVYSEIRNGQENVTRISNGCDDNLGVIVNIKKLDKIQAMRQAVLNLRVQDEFIRLGSPQYLLDNLENVKRDLTTRAMEDAQKHAAEPAETDGGKVGAMHSVSQGSFNIYADSDNSEDDEHGRSYGKATIGKQVRLVATIECGIE